METEDIKQTVTLAITFEDISPRGVPCKYLFHIHPDGKHVNIDAPSHCEQEEPFRASSMKDVYSRCFEEAHLHFVDNFCKDALQQAMAVEVCKGRLSGIRYQGGLGYYETAKRPPKFDGPMPLGFLLQPLTRHPGEPFGVSWDVTSTMDDDKWIERTGPCLLDTFNLTKEEAQWMIFLSAIMHYRNVQSGQNLDDAVPTMHAIEDAVEEVFGPFTRPGRWEEKSNRKSQQIQNKGGIG